MPLYKHWHPSLLEEGNLEEKLGGGNLVGEFEKERDQVERESFEKASILPSSTTPHRCPAFPTYTS